MYQNINVKVCEDCGKVIEHIREDKKCHICKKEMEKKNGK